MLLTYEIVKKTFEDKGCTLLTTKEDMINNNLKATSKYRIISSCGHEYEDCYYHMFKYRNTGYICKTCVNKNIVTKLKIQHENFIEGNSFTLDVEKNGMILIMKYISENIIFKKADEGCLADIYIKLNNITDYNWLPIKVKSTLKGNHNIYTFNIKKYINMYLLLICVNKEKLWLVNGNDFIDNIKISIGIQKSKYSKYEINKENLSDKLIELYNKGLYLDKECNINKPISICQQKEQLFKHYRESKLNNIVFEYPLVNQAVYDFKINNKKIQEKTAYKYKKSIYVALAKNNNGKKNQPYEENDNDYYWINEPNKIYFYIIPSKILVNKNHISNGKNNANKNLNITTNNYWLQEYKYNYTDENINDNINNLLM